MLSLVVDSSANLTRAEAARLGVTMVPMTYRIDGELREETFMGENGDFAQALHDKRLTEAHGAKPEAFQQAFSRLVETGSDVVCITTSAKVSSCYRSACKAADQVRSAIRNKVGATSREANSAAAAGAAGLPRIKVLDSMSTICGVESLASLARKLDASGASFDDIVATLEAARADQGIGFSVPSTATLRHTGRMALIPLSVGTFLNRYPVLSVRDGAVIHVKTTRGVQNLAHELVELVPTDAPRNLTLTYFGTQGRACTELLRCVRDKFSGINVRVKEGGPVLASILGPGAVSLAWGPAAKA